MLQAATLPRPRATAFLSSSPKFRTYTAPMTIDPRPIAYCSHPKTRRAPYHFPALSTAEACGDAAFSEFSGWRCIPRMFQSADIQRARRWQPTPLRCALSTIPVTQTQLLLLTPGWWIRPLQIQPLTVTQSTQPTVRRQPLPSVVTMAAVQVCPVSNASSMAADLGHATAAIRTIH